MARFSNAFDIRKSQRELDFVDVELERDSLLFVDPFAISQRPDPWAQKCHDTLSRYFQQILEDIRRGRDAHALELLQFLREPNETRLGFSRAKPQGAGIGTGQAEKIFDALKNSKAVETGFLSSLEECELMIEGIGRDKISDLTTNVIRRHLIEYTQQQCDLHGAPLEEAPLPPCFNPDTMKWASEYHRVPIVDGKPVVLVPKGIVRYNPAYTHDEYYHHFVLNFLQEEHLRNGSSLVVTLKKSGRQVVYKEALKSAYPGTKDYLYEFSNRNPEVLRNYREHLKGLENSPRAADVDTENEVQIAHALKDALQTIRPGRDTATQYHRWVIGAVEFLFFPHLVHPVKEQEIHEGRKRIDIRMDNSAGPGGIFWRLQHVFDLPCPYLFFECKNYSADVSNNELDQLSGRFAPKRGKVGFLCFRDVSDMALLVSRCKDTFSDNRGLIVALDDRRIVELLDLIKHVDQVVL